MYINTTPAQIIILLMGNMKLHLKLLLKALTMIF